MARKKVPQFANEDEERAFWSEHDSTEYLDWSQARRASAPNLRPTLQTISLRMPAALLAELKTLANKRDVPYQSLLKSFLAERVAAERSAGSDPAAAHHSPQPNHPRQARPKG